MPRAFHPRSVLPALAALLTAAAIGGCSLLPSEQIVPPASIVLSLPQPEAPPAGAEDSAALAALVPPAVEPPGMLARLIWNDEFGERTIVFDTPSGTVKLRQVGSGSLMLKFGDTVVHVNPWSKAGEYASLPKADQIWITDPSPEHLDLHAIRAVSTDSTQLIVDAMTARQLRGLLSFVPLLDGVEIAVDDIELMALPAFRAGMSPDGPQLDPSNSYLATFGEFRLFLAGQAHFVPGIQGIEKVDIALLSLDDLSSLSSEQAAEITRALDPIALLPYQYGDDDPAKLAELLSDSTTMILPLNSSKPLGPLPIGTAPDRDLVMSGLYLENQEPDPALLATLFDAQAQANPLLLPDLITLTPSSLYITRSNNTSLLRLTNSVWNAGYGPLELWGRIGEDPGTHSVVQRIFQADSEYQERVVGEFIFHPGHNHWHLESFSLYELWSLSERGTLDRVAATSDKVSYCLRDIHRVPHPDQAPRMGYGTCTYGRQGLSVGWADVYDHYLPGQSIDISGLPDGVYALISTADPYNLIQESDETNNAAVIYLEIAGTLVSILGRPASSGS
ncbi:MAG: lysyl oxidase family protein [Anaerolineales bacterium]